VVLAFAYPSSPAIARVFQGGFDVPLASNAANNRVADVLGCEEGAGLPGDGLWLAAVGVVLADGPVPALGDAATASGEMAGVA
jgi:hypothetical protein